MTSPTRCARVDGSAGRLFCGSGRGAQALTFGNVRAGQAVKSKAAQAGRTSVADFGAVGDGRTLNTTHIQSAINQLASRGGGTLVIPKGVFLSGAIFLKPGVNLHLEEGAVLKGSTDRKDYPKMRTRIEGHFEEWLPALVNADKTDHLRIGASSVGRQWLTCYGRTLTTTARRTPSPRLTNNTQAP